MPSDYAERAKRSRLMKRALKFRQRGKVSSHDMTKMSNRQLKRHVTNVKSQRKQATVQRQASMKRAKKAAYRAEVNKKIARKRARQGG